MKKTFMLGAIGVMFSSNAFASGNPVSVQDNYKNVIVKNPYTVEAVSYTHLTLPTIRLV